MASFTLTHTIEQAQNSDGDTVYHLKAYISETSGFTIDPGNKVFLTQSGPDSNPYFERVCLCSDIYNYPEDSIDNVTPFYRREWIYRAFERIYQASEFIDQVESDLSVLAGDWENLQTTASEESQDSFTGGTLYLDRVESVSSSESHETGEDVTYRLLTVQAVLDHYSSGDFSSPSPSPSPSPSGPDYAPVFVLSSDGNSLERVAVYDDMNSLSEGSEGGERTSGIQICTNLPARETSILTALKEDLEHLDVELDFMS